MAIDYIIDYPCEPKRALSSEGIVERLKGAQRAQTIIRLFRDNGDQRPVSEMGFEFTRSTPEGQEERQIIMVQDLLDAADELMPHAPHCQGCPANRTGRSFGCVGFVQYPLSEHVEHWLLDRLPVPDETLVWLLLKQGVEEFKYDGAQVRPMRAARSPIADSDNPGGMYFLNDTPPSRRLGELRFDADQLFEMLFGVGPRIQPSHAGILLLILHAIPRDLEADQIMALTPAPADAQTRHPFILKAQDARDEVGELDLSTHDLIDFLHALYIGWRLGHPLVVDA